LIAVTLLILNFYLSRYTARLEVERVEQRLAAEARLLATEVAGVLRPHLGDWVREAAARAQTRVTVIDPQGAVLADSDHNPETMDNHANRPEVRQARQGYVGTAIRHSATLNRDLCYVALPVEYVVVRATCCG